MNFFIIVTLLLYYTVNGVPVNEPKSDIVEPRFVKIPDGNGDLIEVDLEASVQTEFIERITRDPGNEYWLFTRNNPENYQLLVMGDPSSVQNSNFDPSKPTMVIAHGGFHSAENEPNPILRGVYLERHDANIITVDWRRVAQNDYVTAVLGVPPVGRALGDFLAWLHNNFGLSYDTMHLVGFSLGAHVVGVAGRQVGRRINRITGLDPAGPLWLTNPEILSPNDGRYVEAIHTDGAYPGPGVGIGQHIVQVDFFPNGGLLQPGCSTNVCNHNRAYELFAASITFNHLLGRRCLNYTQVGLNLCNGVILPLGNDDLGKTGDIGMYRLNTGATYPY